MSVRVLSAVLDYFPNGGAQKLALVILADYANDSGGNCYPSMATIARKMCCSVDQARRHVHALIRDRYVAVESEGGGAAARRYQINLKLLTPRTDARAGTDARAVTDARTSLASSYDDPSHGCKPIRHYPSVPTTNMATRFDRWWSSYPRKVAKQRALKAWAKLKVDDTLLAAMLAAVDRQRNTEAWTKDGGAYVPHPATWLNDRRWEDEAMPANSAPAEQRRCHCGAPEAIMIAGRSYCTAHKEAA